MANQLSMYMPPFDPDLDVGVNAAPKWKLWVCDFTTFSVANAINTPNRKRAMLLFLAGPGVREIFRQLSNTGSDDYETALANLNEYLELRKNRVYEVCKFRHAKQQPQESIDQFHTRLCGLGATCEFHDLNFESMLHIVLNGTSSHLRKQALRDCGMTLQQLLLLGCHDEMSQFQAADIEGREAEDFDFIRKKKGSTQRQTSHKSARKTCNNCGGEWPHQNGPCPASGQTCRNFQKLNHFARKCRSKAKHAQATAPSATLRLLHTADYTSSDSEADFCYAIETGRTQHPTVNVKLTGQQQKTKFTIDTGSSTNVISFAAFQALHGIRLQKTDFKAYPFNSKTTVAMKGKFQTTIETGRKIAVATIYVTVDDRSCLLGSKTSQN